MSLLGEETSRQNIFTFNKTTCNGFQDHSAKPIIKPGSHGISHSEISIKLSAKLWRPNLKSIANVRMCAEG